MSECNLEILEMDGERSATPDLVEIRAAKAAERRQSEAERQHAAALAWADWKARQVAIEEQTVRLRASRLARDMAKV